jgi:hypothetical protein
MELILAESFLAEVCMLKTLETDPSAHGSLSFPLLYFLMLHSYSRHKTDRAALLEVKTIEGWPDISGKSISCSWRGHLTNPLPGAYMLTEFMNVC